MSWPTTKSPSTLAGLGLASNVAKSAEILHWTNGDYKGNFQPYVNTNLALYTMGVKFNGTT